MDFGNSFQFLAFGSERVKPQGVMQGESSLIAAVEFLSNHGTFTYSVA